MERTDGGWSGQAFEGEGVGKGGAMGSGERREGVSRVECEVDGGREARLECNKVR